MIDGTEDFNNILLKCGYGIESSVVVIEKISSLVNSLDIEKFKYFLAYSISHIDNIDILIELVKLSNNYKDNSILNVLTDLLIKKINTEEQDKTVNLKVLCIKAISNYKIETSVQVLLYCLNNKSEHYKVRLACADALGRLGNKYAVTSLINVVSDDEEKSIYVKESATFALGMLGDTSAIDPLIQILEAKQSFMNSFSFLKEKIVEALGKLNYNNKKILKVLKNALYDNSPMVRINAIEALMNSEFSDAENLIRIALKDSDNEVQRNALIALYNMIGRDILDEIISLPSYSDFLKIEAKNLIEEYEEDNE